MCAAIPGLVRVTLLGPDAVWFGVGFGAFNLSMETEPYSIIVDGTGAVSER